MKIVKNVCFGGFSLSQSAMLRLSEITGKSIERCLRDYYYGDEARSAPELVQVVEELGEAANGPIADLLVVEVPDDVDWYIASYDGVETIEEVHRSW